MKSPAALAAAAFLLTFASLAAAASPAGLESARPGNVVDIAGKTATVKEIDITPIVNNEYAAVFHFGNFDRPALKELREKYHLNQVIAPGKDELEKQALLCAWVNKTITFGPPKSDPKDALAILKSAAVGQQFNCGYFEITLEQAASSLGWVARDIGLKGARDDGNGSEHSICELWSNQYKKWVMFDPTGRMYVEKSGVPADAYEIRQDWFYNQGQDLTFVLGADRKKYTRADMPLALGTFKNFGPLTVNPNSIGKFLIIMYVPTLPAGGPDYTNMFIIKDNLANGVESHTRKNPGNPATEAYWPMNQSALKLIPLAPGTLKVDCATNTPDFDHYRTRIDGNPETNTLPEIWPLHAGTNALEVSAVNKQGIVGEHSKIVLEMK